MLDFALDATFAFGLGYVVLGLTAHLAYRWQHPKASIDQVKPQPQQPKQPIAQAAAPAAATPQPAAQHQPDQATARPTRRQLLVLAKAARLPGYSRLSTDQLADALANVRAIA